MAKKKRRKLASAPEVVKRKRKEKGETQVHSYRSVMVMGPTGKLRMEKHPR